MAGLPLGTPAPAFRLVDLAGTTLTLDALRTTGRPVVLIFSDPNCGPCAALWPEVARWQRDYANALTIALVSRGTLDANRAESAEQGLTQQVLLQQDREVAEAYQALATPSAVLVHSDGTIGSSVAAGADAIRALVAHTLELPVPGSAHTPCPRCGQHHGHGAAGAARMIPQGAMVGALPPR